MSEIAGIVLGGVALFQPAIKACYNAYGFFRLTANFGPDYITATRMLHAQKARLEQLTYHPLISMSVIPTEGSDLARQILDELQAIKRNFQLCQDLMKHYLQQPIVPNEPNHLVATPPLNVELRQPGDTSPSGLSSSSVGRASKSKPFFKLLSLSRKKNDSAGSSSKATAGSSTSALGANVAQPLGSEEMPAILVHPSIDDLSNRETQRADRLRHSTGLWARGKWSASHREKFFDAIARVKESNDTLQSLIQIRSILKSTVHLGNLGGSSTLPKQVSSTQDSLYQLHQALMASDGIRSEDSLKLSIKLSTDHSQTKNQFAGHENLEFTKESNLFILQAHEGNSEEADDKSKLLVVESPPVQRGDDDISLGAQTSKKRIKNLRQALVCISSTPDNMNAFEHLGLIPSPSQPTCTHSVYQAVDDLGERFRSLADVLAVEELGNVKFASQHLDLALLIIRSLLYFLKTRPLTALTQTTDYVYYRSATTADDEDATEYMDPYLCLGFGSPSKKKGSQAIAKASGVAPSPRSQVIALGILLYQIASWKPLDEAVSSSNLTRLRDQVKNTLHVVERRHGLSYSPLLLACLDFKETREEEQQQQLSRLYEEAFMFLEKVKIDIEA